MRQEHDRRIANDDREEVFRKIMLHVIDRLSDGFTATPRDVFGEQILQLHRLQSAWLRPEWLDVHDVDSDQEPGLTVKVTQ